MVNERLEDITPEFYVRNRMSHNSSEEYFNSIGIERDIYSPVHLSITLIEKPFPNFHFNAENFSFHAEVTLAELAIKERCERVTNLDYCQADYENGRLILVGTGWRPKI